jgi:hypothetical protein
MAGPALLAAWAVHHLAQHPVTALVMPPGCLKLEQTPQVLNAIVLSAQAAASSDRLVMP